MNRVWPYVATVVLTSLLLIYSLRLWRADATVPWVNAGEGDASYELTVARGLLETGWHTYIPRVSAPGDMANKDFPRPDSLHFLLWRLLGLIYANPSFMFNMGGFLSYPLAALTMTWVLRQLNVTTVTAIAFGILYAFLPYHMARWIAGHMLLVMYYTVPVLALLAIWIGQGHVPFFVQDGDRYRVRPWTKSTLFAVLLMLWAGSTSVYYAFFGCFFIVGSGVVCACRLKRWAPLASVGLLALVCGTTILANTWPNRRYVQEHGVNAIVAGRVPEEADLYGLRVAQLLLPRSEHRLDAFDYLRTKYEGRGIPEGANNALGLAGTFGFLNLLLVLFVRRHADPVREHLAVLLVAGILLATIGAFGSLFNFLINADIRAYNRIIVYLAFFSYTATAFLVDRWLMNSSFWIRIGQRMWLTRSDTRRRVLVGMAIVALGYWDQTTGKVPAYEPLAAKFHARANFVREIEANVPPGSMIFQLPFMPYPESGPINKMPDYSPALCYVHSDHLRWSYPALSNRRWARLHQWISEQSTPEMVRTLCLAGFQGIHVDCRGYADRGASLLAELRTLLQHEPRWDDERNFAYFDLGTYATQLKATFPEGEWERASHAIIDRPYYMFQAGFRLGSKYTKGLYLSAVRSTMAIGNPSSQPVSLRLGLTITYYSAHASKLHVRGAGLDQTIDLHPNATRYTFDLDLPTGQHTLQFELETKGTLNMMPNRLTEVWHAEEVTLERR